MSIFTDGVPADTTVNPLDELCPQNEYFVDSSGIYILNGTNVEKKKYNKIHEITYDTEQTG